MTKFRSESKRALKLQKGLLRTICPTLGWPRSAMTLKYRLKAKKLKRKKLLIKKRYFRFTMLQAKRN